jgi:hypothetical protein
MGRREDRRRRGGREPRAESSRNAGGRLGDPGRPRLRPSGTSKSA